MLNINEIPVMKLYKQKVYLPKKDPKANPTMIILLSKNNKTFGKFYDSDRILHRNLYNNYYIDYLYRGKIGNTPQYRIDYKNRRKDIYKEVKSVDTVIRPLQYLSQAEKKNCIFDTFIDNEIFFKKAIKFKAKKKTIAYMNLIKNIIFDERKNNFNKVILIDINDWDFKNDRMTFDNPINLIYFSLWQMLDEFKSIGDTDIILYSNVGMIRIVPEQCDKNTFKQLKILLPKLNKSLGVYSEDNNEIEKKINKEEIIRTTINDTMENRRFFVGESVDNETSDEINEMINDEVEKTIDTEDIEDQEQLASEVNSAKNSKELLSKIDKLIKEKSTGRTNASLARDKKLRDAQRKIKIDNLNTLEELEEMVLQDPPQIEVTDVSDKVKTLNKNVTQIRYRNFDRGYNKKVYHRDVANVFASLTHKTGVKMAIRNIDIEDSSDKMNYKETWTVELEDENRVRHKIKVDMPKFIDDKFLYLGGNKKEIMRQFIFKPIVKTGPDEVCITTSYNKKTYIRRNGKKLNEYIEKIKKLINANPRDIRVRYGNVIEDNKAYITSLEYDEFAKHYDTITIANKTDKTRFVFSQKLLNKMIEELGIKDNTPKDKLRIGILNNSTIIYIDPDSEEETVSSLMIKALPENLKKEIESMPSGKRYVYSTAKVMNVVVPIIFLLGFFEGLSTILKKSGATYRFSDTRPQLNAGEKAIRFKDGYLIYRDTMDIGLLMNAFYNIKTSAYNFEDFDTQEPYLDIFDAKYNSRYLSGAFINFYENMIDPISYEVLNKLDYPTDIIGLMIFANKLLCDNAFLTQSDMNCCRVRGNETVSAILYEQLSDAYGRYLKTSNNKRPIKISIPRDAVLKELKSLVTVEEVSDLNPIYETDKERNVSTKGFSGINLEQSYTLERRGYDPTMEGIVAISSSPDANVGKVRTLTMEPNLSNLRGYVDIKNDKLDELKDTNIFSIAEMLTPMGAAGDDPVRTAMSSKQSKHIIPTMKSSPVLISNGAEQVVQYHLSNTFSIIAKDDGEVVEIDDKTKLIIVRYKNGETQAIDMKPRIVKNGAGGFYLQNQYTCNLKLHQKVKKNDILATDSRFFSDDLFGNRFNLGTFAKVACFACDSTFEDSSMCTEKLSKEMGSELVMESRVVLGKNVNVDYIVNVGDQIKVDEDLIRYEQSFEEESLNNFLSSVGDDLKEEIKSLGKKPVKSHYSGEIADIKIYAGSDTNEMSPSLAKIVKNYYKQTNDRLKLLDKYDKDSNTVKCGILFDEPTEKIEDKYGKIKGEEVNDGVLICFFIKIKDYLKQGDKITFYGPLKTTIGSKIPAGLEPYSEFRPDEEISTFVAPNSVLQRKVPSVMKTMLLNKIIVELKRTVLDIYDNE